VAEAKWVHASVETDAAAVIGAGFAEAGRRDAEHRHRWVALVDGNHHQIDRIEAEAADRGVHVEIIVDVVHVVEYVWEAARVWFGEDTEQARSWVVDRMGRILTGGAAGARQVATGIRRRATRAGYTGTKRKALDRAAGYLDNQSAYMDYPYALANGWPIATGVIEGACRHLVKDRFDITGARWGLEGAQAMLKLRAVINNGDFDAYWAWHLDQEHHRNHAAHYQQKDFTPAA
jgi:hypothetical protein